MNNFGAYRFISISNLISFVIGFISSKLISLKKINNMKKFHKTQITVLETLNKEIGYHQCNLDKLKEAKNLISTKSIFKRKEKALELKDVISKIHEEETIIRETVKHLNSIKSCKNQKALQGLEKMLKDRFPTL